MDKTIIYTKFSKTRKKEVSLRTTISQDSKGNLKVEKKGNIHSKEAIQNLINTYQRIKNISKKFEVVPIKQTGEYTVEFPFIKGVSLHEQVSSANSNKEFHALMTYYIGLLDSIPTVKCSLGKDFENIFGKVDKDKEYICLKEGILDLNLSNFIIDSKEKAHFFDYEWCYDFPIPKDFVLFRALVVFYTNSSCRIFDTVEDLLAEYLEETDSIKQYYTWEEHFQKEIVAKKKNHPTYPLNSIDINISDMRSQNTLLQEEVESVREKNKLLLEDILRLKKEKEKFERKIMPEVEEFRSFKKGRIWRMLEKYRRVKYKLKGEKRG